MSSEQTKARLKSSIDHFMTRNPHSIGRDQTLAAAHERMRAIGGRHLPVMDGGKLVGIVSHRDLLSVETLKDVDPAAVRVEDAMSPDVYVVPPTRALGEVAAMMVERKY